MVTNKIADYLISPVCVCVCSRVKLDWFAMLQAISFQIDKIRNWHSQFALCQGKRVGQGCIVRCGVRSKVSFVFDLDIAKRICKFRADVVIN